MHKYVSTLLLVLLTCAGLASCASSRSSRRGSGGPLPVANPEAVRAFGLTAIQADEALKLYTAKCLRCHKSYDPHGYTSPQWELWMTKMSRKAHLDAQQEDLIVRYLQAVRATRVEIKNQYDVRAVLNGWGPGKIDAELLFDGKATRADGGPAATLIPNALGLPRFNLGLTDQEARDLAEYLKPL